MKFRPKIDLNHFFIQNLDFELGYDRGGDSWGKGKGKGKGQSRAYASY